MFFQDQYPLLTAAPDSANLRRMLKRADQALGDRANDGQGRDKKHVDKQGLITPELCTLANPGGDLVSGHGLRA